MRVKTSAAAKDDVDYDKAWAQRYILDPLTAPEPSQETGPGTSHVNPYRASAAIAQQRREQSATEAAAAAEKKVDSGGAASRSSSNGSSSSRSGRRAAPALPTPPSSASPTRARFHLHLQPQPKPHPLPQPTSYDHQQFQPSLLDTHDEEQQVLTPPGSPPQTLPLHPRDRHPLPKASSSIPLAPHRQHPQFQHRRYPSLPLAATPSPWADHPNPAHPPPYQQQPHPQRPRSSTNSSSASGLHRQRSLSQRFPGDMSHRPLDMLKADARAADRRPHRHRKRISETDTIDALDTIGGAYHHGGPYDATLTSRNLDKKYSPVAAVKDSNIEALRATPRENIVDSLRHHVPLQGTASIPAGDADMSGNVMNYAEGADLMREPDADGGAYKRWPGIPYHPDDLKGKGEPSFTIERDLKAGKHAARLSGSGPESYEMQPGVNADKLAPAVRQRSSSNAAHESSTSTGGDSGHLHRSHSTGKKLSDGLKRRFGSMRRKKVPADEE